MPCGLAVGVFFNKLLIPTGPEVMTINKIECTLL